MITEGIVVIAEQTAAGTEEVASSSTQLSSGMTECTNKLEKVTNVTAGLRTKVQQFRLRSDNSDEFQNDNETTKDLVVDEDLNLN